MKPANAWLCSVLTPTTKAHSKAGHGVLLLVLALLALSLAACTAPRKVSIREQGKELGRADPGYLYWLERQSMLGAASAIIRDVSATPLLWRFPMGQSRPEMLIRGSAVWLQLSPQTFVTSAGQPLLRELGQPATLNMWKAMGLGGVMVEHALESGRAWFPDRAASILDDDATSLNFAADVGTDADWAALMNLYLNNGLQLGLDLPGLATGGGPDFTLATSAVRDWPGAYLMLEIPRSRWSMLPDVPSGAQGMALAQETVSALAAETLLPFPLERDTQHLAAAPSWAATGEVRGHDGNLRRWVYRFDETPARPVLLWDDPSGAARRLLAAAVIQQTGLRRTPLIRLHTSAGQGLRLAETSSGASRQQSADDSPLTVLARDVRRYGGWSLADEPLPLTALEKGPDFLLDTVTWPALEWGVLKGDARPLGLALEASIRQKVDQRRLWRPLSQTRPADLRPFGGTVIRTSLPALAASRLGKSSSSPGNDGSQVQALHVLALRIRGSLPGLLVLSGADIMGMPEAAEKLTAWGWGAGSSSARGVARGAALYPAPLLQTTQAGSFVQEVRQMADLRAAYRLAEGEVRQLLPTGNPAVLAWIATVPGHAQTSASTTGLLLTVANFSDTVQQLSLTLPGDAHGDGKELSATSSAPPQREGRLFRLELAPFACRLVLFSTSAH